MEQLADNGDGNYAYIDNLDQARKLFVKDLTATLQVIALDASPTLPGSARYIQGDFNTWDLTENLESANPATNWP